MVVGRLVEVRAVRPEYEANYANRPEPHCWVYEVWDTRGRLAYVGVADDFERRWRQHMDKSWWLSEIDIWYIDVNGYRTRSEARQVEAAVINEQHPVYNTNLELRWYAKYQEVWTDPERPDEFDCVPVRKRRFMGVGGEHGTSEVERGVRETVSGVLR